MRSLFVVNLCEISTQIVTSVKFKSVQIYFEIMFNEKLTNSEISVSYGFVQRSPVCVTNLISHIHVTKSPRHDQYVFVQLKIQKSWRDSCDFSMIGCLIYDVYLYLRFVLVKIIYTLSLI